MNLSAKADLIRQSAALLLRAEAEEIESRAILARCEERLKLVRLPPPLASRRRNESRGRAMVAAQKAEIYRREAARLAREAENLPGVIPDPEDEARRLSAELDAQL
jgi:hypothetical protein